MTAANSNAAGASFVGSDPMIPAPGPNTSPNTSGIPNVANYFMMGGNQQNLATLRAATIDAGGILGAASGTNSAQMQPMQGSLKYFLQAMPATRLGDLAVTNNNNIVTAQLVPSQTKYFVNA